MKDRLYVALAGEVGPIAQRLVAPIVKVLSAFYRVETIEGPRRPLVEKALRPARREWEVNLLAPDLGRHMPPDALVALWLVDEYLCTKGVSSDGASSPELRVAVREVRRHREHHLSRVERFLLKRCARQAITGVGRALGLACTERWCVMNTPAASLERDPIPLAACPRCDAKLAWNLGFDPATRGRILAATWEEMGLEDEAWWCRRRGR